MQSATGEYINGFLQKTREGRYEGELHIEGIDISPIFGVLFKQDGKNYLWLRRKDLLIYDEATQKYIKRKREPRWEAYLEKQMNNDVVEYKGEFLFLRFRFTISGVWDGVFGRDKQRLNFYVDRLPMAQQDIIRGLSKKMSER